jgi:FkbM family methyltransferase
MDNICTFTNDNNIIVKLIDHPFSESFRLRDNHEVLFRKLHTYLINNKIIKNNIIDLGAWIGDNSIPWSRTHDGIIYAIDPSPENIKFIRALCEKNDIHNVITIQKAISDIPRILSTNEDLHHCSFVYGQTGENGVNKVVSYTLDNLYSNKEITNIGYIHLDVEGMEYAIVRGAENILNKYRPILTFEQHLEIDDYIKLSQHIKYKNYDVYMINEVLPGCRPDCRNFIGFPKEIITNSFIENIHIHLGVTELLNPM